MPSSGSFVSLRSSLRLSSPVTLLTSCLLDPPAPFASAHALHAPAASHDTSSRCPWEHGVGSVPGSSHNESKSTFPSPGPPWEALHVLVARGPCHASLCSEEGRGASAALSSPWMRGHKRCGSWAQVLTQRRSKIKFVKQYRFLDGYKGVHHIYGA